MHKPHHLIRGIVSTQRHAVGLLATLLLIAAVGCASNGADQSADGKAGTGATASDDSKGSGTHGGDGRDTDAGKGGKAAAAGAGTRARAAGSDGAMPGTTGGANHVRILEQGCVQFEPRWAEIAVGSSINWTSEAKQPVTIHFPAGVFSRSEFTVPPGGRLASGPALKAGAYPLWTSPSSCQDAPLGARGSGPGVAVEAAGSN